MEEPTGPTTDEATGPTGPTTEEATGPTGPVYTEAEQLAMNPVPTVEPSPYIITLDELKETQEALSHKESLDRSTVIRFVEPDTEELKRKLLQWATVGLPNVFQLFSVSIEPPTRCMDGISRPKFEYIEYLLGTTIYEKFQLLQVKLPGMVLSYSLPDSQLCMHVSKA
jgi:hypothetical protein